MKSARREFISLPAVGLAVLETHDRGENDG